jgi:hypothetical protein
LGKALLPIAWVLAGPLACVHRETRALDYGDFPRKIEIPAQTPQLASRYNGSVLAEWTSLRKDNGKTIEGYVSDNRSFFETVMAPAIEKRLDDYRSRPVIEAINDFALLGHEIYRTWIGREFYRWGGDLFDLDDPQAEGIRHDRRYGIDCSGFASLPYEIAVHFGLLKPEEPSAVFSSKGFEHFCHTQGCQDRGGRGGTSNRYRVDSSEMAELGREVIHIPQGGKASPEEIAKCQAGDLMGRPGHFGIVVEIQGELYYLESGGWVCPPRGYRPWPLAKAIEIFAQGGPLTIRRSLEDGGRLAPGNAGGKSRRLQENIEN